VSAVILYDGKGGTDATNPLIAWQDGKVTVIVAQAVLATATTIVVEPLRAQLWDGTTGSAPVLYWSDGSSSTLNAAAAQGARAITITSQAVGGVSLGAQADVQGFGAGLPFATTGGGFAFSVGTIYATGTSFPTGLYKL